MSDNRKQDLICGCSGTTQGQLEKLIAKGAKDLETLSRATGACSGCGGCEADIRELLAEWEGIRASQAGANA